ncbi:hypothetical protein AX760_24455 [Pararhizobium antarcticum]|uniref:Uncharacterized protein n=1 Tax=Pararhizobium antarcticum TaxID=1798805 RepID=A0A657LLN8_9HYPH|nr:hypothetical protein AX760_24455 [Pararhizobium antarcticum]OJF96132.1 hypothetical protein AX761_16350 [Rhizobium sp. 58]
MRAERRDVVKRLNIEDVEHSVREVVGVKRCFSRIRVCSLKRLWRAAPALDGRSRAEMAQIVSSCCGNSGIVPSKWLLTLLVVF